MDRISNLPDELVCHILSFLYTKEAALTSLLSKRWRNLFVLSPNLCFGIKDFASRCPNITYSFTEFMETVLAMTSDNSPIKNFSLETSKVVDSAELKLWICNLLSRGDLERLHLDIPNIDLKSPKRRHLDIPLEIFNCRTLVTLKLKSFLVPMVPENASLPSLKTLILHYIHFSNHGVCAFEILLSACSVLEELEMHCVGTVDLHCTISSPTLKRLTLDSPNSRSLTFDTPSLAYLHYSFHTRQEVYPYVNLDSLVEAKLFLYSNLTSSPENLIKGLRNVRVLDLMIARTMEIFYTFREAIPVFKNLYHLTIVIPDNEYYRVLPLLKNAPNLVTLVIQCFRNRCGKEPELICESFSGACLLACRVKVLEINMRDNSLEMGQWKHFLEKLSCLELVKVSFWDADEKQHLQLAKNLLKLPRSSKYKIELKFRSSYN